MNTFVAVHYNINSKKICTNYYIMHYVQISEVCKFSKMSVFFLVLFLRIFRPSIVSRFYKYVTYVTSSSHITSDDIWSRNLHLECTCLTVKISSRKCYSPLLASYRIDWLRSIVVSLNLSLSEVVTLVTTFETGSAAAAGKVEICHHPSQVSNIGSH